MQRRTRSGDGGRAGFTLIELLAVMAIIGILAGLVLGIARFANDKADRSAGEAEFQKVLLALDEYKAEFGSYPVAVNNLRKNYPNVSASGGYVPDLGKYLYTDALSKKGRSFIDPELAPAGQLRDHWGTQYLYECPKGSESCSLLSLGADAKAGSAYMADDIKNW